MRPWTIAADGLRLALRVTARARREAVGGVHEHPDGPRLEIAVNAPPEDGKANAAVVALLAKALGVPKGAVRLVQGAANRHKLVTIAGDAETLVARLEALVTAAGIRR